VDFKRFWMILGHSSLEIEISIRIPIPRLATGIGRAGFVNNIVLGNIKAG
jgi:hypothetical protein